MKKIRFAETYQDGVIVYPDDTSKFSNITATGGFVYAAYSGELDLTEAEKPYAGSWVIEVPAYLRRFDWLCEKPKQAEIACDPHPICQGMMSLALSRVREGIDLKSESLPLYLAQLVKLGKITEAEAALIPSTPPLADELFKGA